MPSPIRDYANQPNNLLRRTGASTEELRQQTKQTGPRLSKPPHRNFRTRMQAPSVPLTPEGYAGPDLYLFMYVDTTQVNDANCAADAH